MADEPPEGESTAETLITEVPNASSAAEGGDAEGVAAGDDAAGGDAADGDVAEGQAFEPEQQLEEEYPVEEFLERQQDLIEAENAAETFDHDAAKKRLLKYKKEAEARRRKKYAQQQKEAKALEAELKNDRERMQQRLLEQKAQAKQKHDEKLRKQREERERDKQVIAEHRKRLGKELKQRDEPLYKRKEKEERENEARAEMKRQAAMQKRRDQFKPLDFEELRRQAREHVPGHLRQSGQSGSCGDLPPVKTERHYVGTARARVMQDMSSARNKVLLQRQEAAARKAKASRYSKLVTELVPAGGKGQLSDPANSAAPHFQRTDSAAIPMTRNGLAPASLAAGARGNSTSRSPAKLGHSEAMVHSAPGRLGTEEAKKLSARASALNKQARQMEEQILALTAVPEDGSGRDVDAIVQSRAQLSNCYIDAIRTKIELLESIRV